MLWQTEFWSDGVIKKEHSRKKTRNECMAPTTARSKGIPPTAFFFGRNPVAGCDQALELFWALAQMQRRDSSRQILVLNLGESNPTHHVSQFPLVRKSSDGIRQILICAP